MSDKNIESSNEIPDETLAKLDKQLSAPETKATLDAGQIWSSIIDDYKFACNNGTRGYAQYLVDMVMRPAGDLVGFRHGLLDLQSRQDLVH